MLSVCMGRSSNWVKNVSEWALKNGQLGAKEDFFFFFLFVIDKMDTPKEAQVR